MRLIVVLRDWLRRPYAVPDIPKTTFDEAESRAAQQRMTAQHEQFERALKESFRKREYHAS